MVKENSLKILSIGNSFAVDTNEYLPKIAQNLGVMNLQIVTLYIGGCSINRHYSNALSGEPAYVAKAYEAEAGEWREATELVSLKDAIGSDDWDFISIQHGTGDGSRYTLEESYKNLSRLVAYVRQRANPKAKLVFNMAWVMEPDSTHPEIRFYNGDQLLMYQKLADLTARIVLPMPGLDLVSPAGTAIQNARATGKFESLSRDGFHLSLAHGRYVAALTFFGTLAKVNLDDVTYAPDGVGEEERLAAIECAKKAIKSPFEITR